MFRSAHLMPEDALRATVRKRRLATLLATLVALQREAADSSLSRGAWEEAASREESSALAAHRLGLFEDAMLAILRGERRERYPNP